MTLDTILFDLDGTLVDSTELILAAYRHTCRVHRGRELPDELWLRGIGTPLQEQLRELAEGPDEVDTLLATYREFSVREHDRMIRRFEGMDGLLDRLADGGFTLGIVTSKRRRGLDRALRACELEGRFAATVSADDTQRHKPDPTPVLLALEQLSAPPSRAAFIGDSLHDLIAGRRAGVRTGAALWAPFDRARLAPGEPTWWLTRPSDLWAALAELQG